MTPPIRPGPAVAATASTSARLEPGFREHLLDQRREQSDMPARGDFGDDAAKGPVVVLLPRDALREDAAVAGHQRGGGFVAGGFEAEDDWALHGARHRWRAVEGRCLSKRAAAAA